MPTTLEDQRFAKQSATVFHPMSAADKTAMATMRAIVEPHKGSCGELQRAHPSTPSWSMWLFLKA